MHLQALAAAATRAVSPATQASLWSSSGSTILPSGSRVPKFDLAWGMVDVQGVRASMIEHLAELNISGVMRQVWLRGDWQSAVRAAVKGGDLMVFAEANGQPTYEWKVVLVAETWQDWCSVVVVQTRARALPSMQAGAPQALTLAATDSQTAQLPFQAAWANGSAAATVALVSGTGAGLALTPGSVQVTGNGTFDLPVQVASAAAPSGTSVYAVTISGGGAECIATLSVTVP